MEGRGLHLARDSRPESEYPMIVKRISTGGDRNFGYVLTDDVSGKAALIDPSYDPDGMVDWALGEGLSVSHALITHDHHDHTNGNDRVRERTGASIVMHDSSDTAADILVVDGDVVTVGGLQVGVIHTPGHHPTAVCYHAGGAVFTGDTLFVGKVGGTDLDRGAREEYDSLHGKLMKLPGETRVLPGHDVGTEAESTISHELATNPFLLQATVEEFIDLKRNWAAYKERHGIA